MALTPTDKRAATDEAFLREVDDAVRAGDLENFWKRYDDSMRLADEKFVFLSTQSEERNMVETAEVLLKSILLKMR